jgi:hypothetical protein
LGVLLVAAVTTCEDRLRSTRWRDPLFVSIYPIAADDSPVTRSYLAALDDARFKPIDRFFTREAARYHLYTDEPVRTRLRAELRSGRRNAGRTRDFWRRPCGVCVCATGRGASAGTRARTRGHPLFVLYHDPSLTPTVPHSLGLTKGLIGVVYAFASPEMNGENNVVIAHEMLHTVGATDKYNVADDLPRFPDGYGDPRQIPLYPQLARGIDGWAAHAGARQMPAGGKSRRSGDRSGERLEIRWPQHAR